MSDNGISMQVHHLQPVYHNADHGGDSACVRMGYMRAFCTSQFCCEHKTIQKIQFINKYLELQNKMLSLNEVVWTHTMGAILLCQICMG